MRIAAFTDTFYPKIDGIVTSILGTIRQCRHNDIHWSVFAPDYKKLDNTISLPNTTIHRYFSVSLHTYKDVKISLPNLWKILSDVRSFKPDVIHIHTPGTLGLMGILAGKMLDIPILGTYHTIVAEQAMYLLPYLKKTEGATNTIPTLTFSTFRKGSGTIAKASLWRFSCWMYNRCDAVIASTKSIQSELVKHGLKKDIHVLSVGIDAEHFKKKGRYEGGQARFLYVGRLGYEKNIHILIEAFCLVADKLPASTLTIIGEGPAERDLKTLARKKNGRSRVHFLKAMPREHLQETYAKYDIFVTASTMETLGLTILEAMSSGLPVIGADSYAIPDIVRNGQNGFLVKSSDIDEFSQQMLTLGNDWHLRERLGRQAILTAEKHDVKKIAKQLSVIYHQLLRVNTHDEQKLK